MSTKENRLRELAIKFLEKINGEKSFKKREALLELHQRKHDKIVKEYVQYKS